MTETLQIPGYRLGDEIGRGGMATVYRAEQESLGRIVAIKVMALPRSDEEFAARFVREARTLAQLSHPGIVTIFDAGTQGDARYLVMECIAGGDLAEQIKASGKLEPARALRVFRQCAEALDHAHSQGFVHRDIKPENILVREGGAVAVTDFGIARGQDHRLTKTGTMVGTPSYMSPEQIRDLEIDGRSDQYSLGVVLFEMLAGQAPFRATESTALAMKHLMDVVPALPDELASYQPVLDQLMAKGPAQRFANCSSAADALERIAGGGTLTSIGATTAVNPEIQGENAPWPVQPTGALSPHTEVSGATAISGGFEAAAVATTQTSGGLSSPPTSRGRKLGIGLAIVAAVLASAAALYGLDSPSGPGPETTTTAPIDEKSVAVLPLSVLSSKEEDQFLAAGLHDTLLTELTRVRDLRVISRNSVKRFANSSLGLDQIAAELAVAHVMEGSLQRVGDRVRVNAQLVRAASDEHLWAEVYDRQLDDIFAVQANMAKAIAGAVQAQMTPAEEAQISRGNTRSPGAIAAYLKARGQSSTYQAAPLQRALGLLEEAVANAPDFADAQALLARLSSWSYFRGVDRSPERREIARRAIEAAMALAPDLGETKLAVGAYLYYVVGDLDAALPSFGEAVRLLPGDAEALRLQSGLQLRINRPAQALEAINRAVVLDPYNQFASFQRIVNLMYMHQFTAAVAAATEASATFPDNWFMPWLKASNQFVLDQDGATLRRWLEQARTLPENPVCATRLARYEALMALEQYSEAARNIGSCGRELMPVWSSVLVPKTRLEGEAWLAAGERDAAVEALRKAAEQLSVLAKRNPEDGTVIAQIGLVDALLRREGACTDIERALQLLPWEKNALAAADIRLWAVGALAHCGEKGRAVTLLGELWEGISGFMHSPAYVKSSPLLEPLRGDATFQALLNKQRH